MPPGLSGGPYHAIIQTDVTNGIAHNLLTPKSRLPDPMLADLRFYLMAVCLSSWGESGSWIRKNASLPGYTGCPEVNCLVLPQESQAADLKSASLARKGGYPLTQQDK